MPAIPLSLYIHTPWCVQKCPYCDFNSHNIKQTPDYDAYINHLIEDLKADLPLVQQHQLQSIFIGGGTPSLFSATFIDRLLKQIALYIDFAPNIEITIESNPNSADAEQFKGYIEAGINRISIGVQSFQNDKLERLGRIHNTNDAITAAKLARSLNIHSFNLDLMHGLPNQTLDDALFDLQSAIDLSPTHLSWYQLTIEPNTLFGSKPPILPNEDLLWDIYQQGHQLLTSNGYQQYETSAYAKPGFKCQHNLNYWRFGDYLGIGCGAHGKLTQANGDIIRTIKTRHPHGYMQGRYLEKSYTVPKDELPFEYFMNQFRLFEPAKKQQFTERTFLPISSIHTQMNNTISKGYITEDNDNWYLTNKGKLFLNSLLELFL
ncbi:radical SAM family heme chaperone HemW [Orbaceae bacterium ac157xtp]